MKVQTAINNAFNELNKNNIRTALLDCEILMAQAIKKNREFVILNSNQSIQDKIYDAVQQLASNNKYAVIFDSSSDLIMLYSNPNLDKSDKILEILGY